MEKDMRFFLAHIAQTSGSPIGLEIESAEGIYLFTPEGKKYLDLIAGVGVNNVGHRHPAVVRAIELQLRKHLHVMAYGEFVQKSSNQLASMLLSMLPSALDSCYFVNSGTEANEGALKLARRCTGRTEIIACRGAYHGSTMGSMSVSGNESRKAAFRPLVPGVRFIQFNNPDDLSLITKKTACIIMETIQGDAGVIVPSKEFMQAVRKRCDDTGALLILDEVQCGMGRTGTTFAFEQFGIVPDIVTLGKALGGGLPLGAFIAPRHAMETLTHDPALGHITTFGGNPLSCAAGTAVMSVITEKGFLAGVVSKGKAFQDQLTHQAIKAIRQVGLMIALDFESPEAAGKVTRSALDHGLITFRFLSNPHSVRITPPLTITDQQITESCKVFIRSLDRAFS